MNENDKVIIKKPPASKKSSRFKDFEDKAVQMLGEDYWDWLEEKHKEYVLNKLMGFKN